RIARGAAGQPGPFAHQAAVFNLAFTALAVVIAIVGWVLGGDAVNFLDVLVVAAPAGLIWAVPLAIQAGLARTLQHGVYVRTGSVLERLAALQSIAFAQTGIITTGDMQLDAVTAVAPHDKPTVLSIAAALLQGSGSTQARAVGAAATAANLKLRRLKRVRELTGSVRQATISGTVYYIGDRGSLEANGLVFPPKLKADAKPSLYVVTDEAILGRLTFSDALRPETIQTLERLHDFDIRKTFLMAEGGHAAGEALADTVGIREVIALHTTADKLRTLEAVHKRPMAFVGNGVADATLMSAVDIGISIGARASNAASEAASVIVLRDNLALVAVMIAIARRTFGIARQAVAIVTGLSVLFMILFAIAHFPAIYGVILVLIIETAGLLLALRAHHSKISA
ncbi:MAG TPA: hypothetical protein VFH39_00850, partial [Candidatus Saccharimonadales bacterium]|nr:hypothetical protein [Candidatus Saccharimonadales bacterium]